MAFSCDICKRGFAEKRCLNRHVKELHGNLWSYHRCSQSFNRRDNYEMHQQVCLFKTIGKRSGEDLEDGTTVKKLKDNVSRVADALDGTVSEYRLNLEDEQQDASNVLNGLKGSTFQMENRINEEIAKKRAVRFYLSLHVYFHLSTDLTFLTDPPAVFSTDAVELYNSNDVHVALNSIYGNLVPAIEDFQQCGSGWILDKLLGLDLHLLKFNPLRATSYIPLPA